MKNNLVLLFILMASSTHAQIVKFLGDLNPGSKSSVFEEGLTAIYFNDQVYFSADVDSLGTELFTFDGDSIKLVKDIYPGSNGSEPRNMFELNDKIVFQADDGTHGYEWWISDGSAEGTNLLVDIFIGEESGVFENPSAPEVWFKIFSGKLFFTGLSSAKNHEPWVTDGSTEGTVMLKNLAADNTSFNTGSFPHNYTELNGSLYFSSREGLWKTDGTTAGTSLVIKVDKKVSNINFEPTNLVSDSSKIYMLTNSGLWISDGTADGTAFIKDIGGGSFNWSGPRIRTLGHKILFAGSDVENGRELWESDGTVDGTKLLIDLWPGSNGYSPQNTTIYNDEYYFKGENGSSGLELFATDGTAAGTRLVKDIKSGSNGSLFLPTNIHSDENYIFMTAGTSAFKLALWQSDGSTEGTVKVSLPNDAERPITYFLFDGKVFFFARTDDTGFEPYIYDPFGVAADLDMDGYDEFADCDDNNANINPGQEEIPNNEIDENCDGELGTSSTKDLRDLNIKISPNPVRANLHIDSDNTASFQILIFNISGNQIGNEKNARIIDTSKWKNGMYFLKIIDNATGEFQISKVIKSGK